MHSFYEFAHLNFRRFEWLRPTGGEKERHGFACAFFFHIPDPMFYSPEGNILFTEETV